MALVTLAEAKIRAKLPLDVAIEDGTLADLLATAEELVLDYVTQKLSATDAAAWAATVEAWTRISAPRRIRAAILTQFTEMQRYRGDDGAADPAPEYGCLSPRVRQLLDRMRDPAIA
jgi:hypothetical protein